MSNFKVVVAADKSGSAIGISTNNTEYGYIRVEQTVNQISENGWMRPVKRSALIKGKVEDLKNAGYKAGQEITGKIVVKEQTTPFTTVNPERDLKVAGTTGVVCKVDGEPIYRNSFFTVDPYTEDQIIQHDNQEEIKEAQAAQAQVGDLLGNVGRAANL